MIFTDEDLTRFKKVFVEKTRIDAMWTDGPMPYLPALIDRLEAAEKVCEASQRRFEVWTRETYVELDDALKCWKLKAGKS